MRLGKLVAIERKDEMACDAKEDDEISRAPAGLISAGIGGWRGAVVLSVAESAWCSDRRLAIAHCTLSAVLLARGLDSNREHSVSCWTCAGDIIQRERCDQYNDTEDTERRKPGKDGGCGVGWWEEKREKNRRFLRGTCVKVSLGPVSAVRRPTKNRPPSSVLLLFPLAPSPYQVCIAPSSIGHRVHRHRGTPSLCVDRV